MKKPDFTKILTRAEEIYKIEKQQKMDDQITREVAKEFDIPKEYIKKAEAQFAEEQRRKRRNVGILVGAIGGILLILLISTIAIRNTLSRTLEEVHSQWSQVEITISRKTKLMPQLQELYERTSTSYIVELADRLKETQTVRATLNALREMNRELSDFIETVIDSDSTEMKTKILDEIAGAENRIAVAARRYNEAVKAYNVRIAEFPTSIAAAVFQFSKMEYFDLSGS